MDENQLQISITPVGNPTQDAVIQQLVNIPYTTTKPTFVPRQVGCYRTIYFDGSYYWLYIYANDAWQTQKIGVKGNWGGTGSDGALSVSSGTTTIDLGSNQVVIKNYSSISITGTGSLAFINPHANGTIIIFRCTGAVTITSSTSPVINLASLGSSAGSGTSLIFSPRQGNSWGTTLGQLTSLGGIGVGNTS